MRWIIIIALFAIGNVLDVLSWVLPDSVIDAAFLYGGVGAAGVAVFRLVRAWGMPLWIGLAGLALPLLYALRAVLLGVELYELTPFLFFNLGAVALLTFGSWTGTILEWGGDDAEGRLVTTGFVFPAMFAFCAFPLAAYIDTFLPERRLKPLYYNASTGEWLLEFLKVGLIIFGGIAAIGAAIALIILAWLTFLRATGFRSGGD